MRKSNVKLTIEHMRQIAAEHSGKCLSEDYVRACDKLTWECAYGHIFDASYHSIHSMKSWCPQCSISYSEEFCRFILESLLGCSFPKDRTVLCGLEIDGYCKPLSIAFEYQGQQHYKFISTWHRTEEMFIKQKERDIAKKVLCEEKNIRLLVIPYTANTDLKSFIIKELNNMGFTQLGLIDESKFRPFRQNCLDELVKIAKERGGVCLSPVYLGVDHKMEWKCKEGHVWLATPASIKSGSWCRACYGTKPLSIDEMRELAFKHNGQCLSNEYVNNYTKLKWQCAEGHIWETVPMVIKKGHWCVKCAQKQRWQRERYVV